MPSRPKINQEVPHKKQNSDRKNGMNSTLFVLITVLMIDRGDPYMIMEKTAAAKPQKSFLALPCKARREIKTTAAKKVSTNAKSPKILVLSFFGAYTMKINTYMISIPAPVPLIVETNRLCFDTKGRPYQKERRQLSKVITYGMPENCSVDLLFIILQNVIIGAKKRNKAVTFPKIPKTECAVSCILFIVLSQNLETRKRAQMRNQSLERNQKSEYQKLRIERWKKIRSTCLYIEESKKLTESDLTSIWNTVDF